jgi:uncharacterized membrane protein
VTLHFGAGGAGDSFAAKSVGSVFALAIVQAVVTAILFVVAFAAPHARAEIDPAGSARRSRRTTRVLTHAVLLLAAGVNACLLLASLEIWSGARTMPGWLALMPVLLVAAVVAGIVAHKVADERAVPRPVPSAVETEVAERDDDSSWRGGIFYVNGDDPAVFVPKRIGIGWTINFGNPKTVAGVFVLVVAIIVVTVATA